MLYDAGPPGFVLTVIPCVSTPRRTHARSSAALDPGWVGLAFPDGVADTVGPGLVELGDGDVAPPVGDAVVPGEVAPPVGDP